MHCDEHNDQVLWIAAAKCYTHGYTRELILPIARELGIPATNVFANRINWQVNSLVKAIDWSSDATKLEELHPRTQARMNACRLMMIQVL